MVYTEKQVKGIVRLLKEYLNQDLYPFTTEFSVVEDCLRQYDIDEQMIHDIDNIIHSNSLIAKH